MCVARLYFQKGDIIEVSIKNEAQDDESSQFLKKLKINVIYEDDHIIAINKPSGMVVHPGVKNKQGTLLMVLLINLKIYLIFNGESRKGIVHRLDADTSGLPSSKDQWCT